MKKFFHFILFLLVFPIVSFSQTGFTWIVKSEMPEPVSNNAVCAAQIGDTHYVYSFCGIDSTKIYSGIHLKAWRYNLEADRWDSLPFVPDSMGKIAPSASYVNGKIYLVGGYHVLSNGNEFSSNKVHVFDVNTNSWLADAAPIPFAIDDQVQAVWRDSLIYVVTGWSNTASFPYVQIYNPSTNTWSQGTQTPNSNSYKCFGATGSIIGDSIFYYGGAANGINFSAQKILRKGIIDPFNPINITWSLLANSPNDAGYRCAPFHWEEQLFWLGGSGISYNYDGIAYNGSGGVPPLSRILQYDTYVGNWIEHTPTPFPLMDFRGAGEVMPGKVIICGGMGPNQETQKTTYLIELGSQLLGMMDAESIEIGTFIYPNPANDKLCFNKEISANYTIFSIEGKETKKGHLNGNEINITDLVPGFYLIQFHQWSNIIFRFVKE